LEEAIKESIIEGGSEDNGKETGGGIVMDETGKSLSLWLEETGGDRG